LSYVGLRTAPRRQHSAVLPTVAQEASKSAVVAGEPVAAKRLVKAIESTIEVKLTVGAVQVSDTEDIGLAAVGGAATAELGGLASAEDTGLGVWAHGLLEAWSGGSESGKGKDDGGELHFDCWS